MTRIVPSVKIVKNHVVDLDYSKRYNETFIYPSMYERSGKFSVDQLKTLMSDLREAGFDVIGGHEYSIAVTGDVILQLAKKAKK